MRTLDLNNNCIKKFNLEENFLALDKVPERCVLVGLSRAAESRWEVEDHLSELNALAQTSGAEVLETFIQERAKPDPAYFIGKGKIEEIKCFIEDHEANLVIFDDELSPAQARNIEKALTVKVIDRSALILDIFANHAQTNEARVQVELAQLNYMLPRLTRAWQHLSRQVGGIGTKGPGETQLETDRRLVRKRISHLEQTLDKITRQKKTQRNNRTGIFSAALIGYTNAGKSTILKALTGSDVLIEDKLFATLDTTVRRLDLNSKTQILLSDTVGFIRKLPHHLVASFRTTLTETLEADLLIQVIDISHDNFQDHVEVVRQLLDELGSSMKPRLLVFNKVDRLKNQNNKLNQLRDKFPGAVFISASRHIGLKRLQSRLLDILESGFETRELQINFFDGGAEHLLYPLATVLERTVDDEYIHLKIKYDKEKKAQVQAIVDRFK